MSKTARSQANRHWPTVTPRKQGRSRKYIVCCRNCRLYQVFDTLEQANATYAAHANFYGRERTDCRNCGGEGFTVDSPRCPACNGTGRG